MIQIIIKVNDFFHITMLTQPIHMTMLYSILFKFCKICRICIYLCVVNKASAFDNNFTLINWQKNVICSINRFEPHLPIAAIQNAPA